MKIQQLQNNNTNFQGLHMDKRASKYFKNYNLLANPNIKECADKFEVMIKSKKVKSNNIFDDYCKELNKGLIVCGGSLCSIIGAVIGTIGTMMPNITCTSANIETPILGPVIGGVLGFIGGAAYPIKELLKKEYDYSLQVGKNIKKSPFGKIELENPISSKHQINKDSLDNVTDFAQITQQYLKRQFVNIIPKYDKNNMFEPTQLLKILNDDDIKQYYKNGECFNYKLENNSNDTMLTKFLDIVPTEENKKDYQEIIKFMRKAKNIDYKQVDSNGISAIEKIINSENPDLLDLVKDTEFDYSRELDYAYERIDDKSFKEKVKNLNINFPDIEQACRPYSTKRLHDYFSELKSPFFKISKILNPLSGEIIDLTNPDDEIKQLLLLHAQHIFQKHTKGNLFEPIQFLKIINDDDIKQYYKNGNFFNYKLEDNSDDTLLTKFLDIVPTEENQKDYQEIIKFMKNAKYIDYNQTDSNGISVIEKIINSENPDLLDLIKDFGFDYSRELDYAYDRIDDKNFKNKVKNLNIYFPNIEKACCLHSIKALEKLLTELKSPFFSTKRLVNFLFWSYGTKTVDIYEAIRFFGENGIDITDMSIDLADKRIIDALDRRRHFALLSQQKKNN